MKINKLRPYLPQETPGPVVSHPNLKKEIKQLERTVQRAEKDIVALRKKYRELGGIFRGPVTVEMIEVTAKLIRARSVLRVLKQKLRRLEGMSLNLKNVAG